MNLANLDPLAQLVRVVVLRIGQLTLESHPVPTIQNIEGLAGLTEVSDLGLYEIAGLSSLAGLENLEVLDVVDIYGNPELVDVTPLAGGKPVSLSSLQIVENPALPSCNAWALAESLEVTDSLIVDGNLPDACGD